MEVILRILKPVVAACVIWAGPALAVQGDALDDLFEALRTAEGQDAARIVDKIGSEWSRSGSPAMDLLLQHGREALDAGDTGAAIEHLTALIDHAPDFAEGYHARATAYFNEQMFGPAIEDLRRTLALNPRHFGAMTGLALILRDIGRDDAALEVWREVRRLYPASPQAETEVRALEAEVEGQAL